MGFFNRLKKNKDEKTVSKQEAGIEIGESSFAKASADKKNKKVEIKKEESVKVKTVSESVDKKTGKQAGPALLFKPLISEKAAKGEAAGVYTFIIDKDANKFDVKKSIKEAYGVEPKKVRIIHIEGKRVYFGQKPGKRSDWKKAIVTLPKGKTISIHEGV